MVYVIPLSIAQRRLDTGNAPQYPQGSPIGGAMQGLGDHLSAVAERYQQMKDQQEAFDAELARRRFNGQIAQAEDEVTANAPADGAGLHEAMYGQVDPYNGRVVKTGLFDKLFAAALPGMPESQRAAFASQKEALRLTGARRMAARQLQRRRDYEQAEVDTALKTSAIAIGNANPDDPVTFEAARQEGLDLIDKMGLDPGIRQQKAKDWFGTAAKARFEALIAKDPKRALEMFGVGAPASGGDATGGSAQTEGSSLSGGSKMAAGKDDRVGTPTPDERIAQAFGDSASAPNSMAIKPVAHHLADLSRDDVQWLIDQAHAANTAHLIEARTNIALVSQNGPDAIAKTGSYAGNMPSPADFAAVYGAEEGGRQYHDFSLKMDVGRQAFGMRTMPNQAIHAALRDAEPGPGSSEEEQTRYRVTAAAALKTLGMRRADPAGYVREVFPNVDAAWKAATGPGSKSEISNLAAYKWAIAVSVAAQRQLGVETPQPLPKAVVQSIADTFGNKDVPQGEKGIILRDLLAAAPDPTARDALSQQLDRVGISWPALVDPIVTSAIGQGRPLSARPGEPRSAFQQAADDFGNYLSEGFEALGRIPHDIGLGLQDLRDSPWGFLEQLPATPGSGAVADGRLALEAVGEAVAKGLAIVRGGTGKLARPIEEFADSGSRAASDLAAERSVARQAVEAESRAIDAAKEAAYRLSTGAKPDKAELLEIIKSIARDPSKVKYPGASFGKALSKNYRKTFLDAYPSLEGQVVVHHAAERQVLTRYIGLVAEDEMHSLQNLRGIPKGLDNLLHKTVFRYEWNNFYRSHPQPTRQQVLDYVTYIDKKYGHLFNPPIGD
ncbi:hypothetical protein [Mesorhizobium carmichaelinearum]|uniref:hypothetical protein n=1 Tax=Mesorhizobium carmichaelinearum TaxID=1208188 RepID=UPI0015CD5A07|nr:hypothetical protein [Mesorhizobium carmichaelinearum]